MFTYALQKSFEELFAAIDTAKKDWNNDELRKDANFRLGSYLHWIMDFWERIEKKATISSEDKSFFSAFRYANNKLKHGKELLALYNLSGGLEFTDFEFPFSSEPIELVWAEFEKSEKEFENQFENYQAILQGKQIEDTINQSKEILNIITRCIDDLGDRHAH